MYLMLLEFSLLPRHSKKKKKLSKIILKSQYDVITKNFLTKKNKKLGI